jgi:hypothetical protein
MQGSSPARSERFGSSTLVLLKRRSAPGSRWWTELLHCTPEQMPLVNEMAKMLLKIDPKVQLELRNVAGEVLGSIGSETT